MPLENDENPWADEPEVSIEQQQQAIVEYQAKASLLIPTDQRTLKSCAEFVEQCKLAEKRVEEKRTALTGPLNKQVDEINKIYMPVRDTFKALGKAVAERAGKYIADENARIQREQQKVIDDAKRAAAHAAAKAEEERKAAEAERNKGNEQAALKREAKAEQLEIKAATVTVEVVEQQERTLDLGDNTLSFAAPKETWLLNSWDKKKPIPALDPRFSPLVGDLKQLPEGLRWLLQMCDVNPVYLNKAFNPNVPFPAPFTKVPVYGKSRLT